MELQGWWALALNNRDSLRELVDRFHPASEKKRAAGFPITARAAENTCQEIRERIVEQQIEDPLTAFDRLLADKKDALGFHQLMEETWFGLPESNSVRSFSGFGALCDLCSELDIDEAD